jgi:hypothetical protein
MNTFEQLPYTFETPCLPKDPETLANPMEELLDLLPQGMDTVVDPSQGLVFANALFRGVKVINRKSNPLRDKAVGLEDKLCLDSQEEDGSPLCRPVFGAKGLNREVFYCLSMMFAIQARLPEIGEVSDSSEASKSTYRPPTNTHSKVANTLISIIDFDDPQFVSMEQSATYDTYLEDLYVRVGVAIGTTKLGKEGNIVPDEESDVTLAPEHAVRKQQETARHNHAFQMLLTAAARVSDLTEAVKERQAQN